MKFNRIVLMNITTLNCIYSISSVLYSLVVTMVARINTHVSTVSIPRTIRTALSSSPSIFLYHSALVKWSTSLFLIVLYSDRSKSGRCELSPSWMRLHSKNSILSNESKILGFKEALQKTWWRARNNKSRWSIISK